MVTYIAEYGLYTSKTFTSFRTTDKKAVITILRYTSDLSLATIVGEINRTILQTMENTWISLQGIIYRLKKLRLFGKIKSILEILKFRLQVIQKRTNLQTLQFPYRLVAFIILLYFLVQMENQIYNLNYPANWKNL